MGRAEALSAKTWETKITSVEPNRILVRGYPIEELMGTVSYPDAVYLLLMGELPNPAHSKMVEAILVSSVDHGVTPPSTLSSMTVASAGAPLTAAIAAGALAISRHHGGAIEACMNVLIAGVRRQRQERLAPDKVAEAIVEEHRAQRRRIPGFGHRYHTDDPRAKRLFELARREGVWAEHIELASQVQAALRHSLGRPVTINVDGAIGAVLCELGFPPALANAFFVISRLPGLVAHIYEEVTTQRPMRRIDPDGAVYTGPGERRPE